MRSLPHHAIPFPKAVTLTSYDTLSRLLIAPFLHALHELVSSLKSKFVGPLTAWLLLVLHAVSPSQFLSASIGQGRTCFFLFVTLTFGSVVCCLFPTLLAFCR